MKETFYEMIVFCLSVRLYACQLDIFSGKHPLDTFSSFA